LFDEWLASINLPAGPAGPVGPKGDTGDAALPTAPGSGTYVLGAVGGVLQWLQTEDCET
jgi:hypothetical protein